MRYDRRDVFRHTARPPRGVLLDVEEYLSRLTQRKHVILTCNGSAALLIALRACGARLAWSPAFTFAAVRSAAMLAVCQLHYSDVDPSTWQTTIPRDSTYHAYVPVWNYGCPHQLPDIHGAIIVDAAAAIMHPHAFSDRRPLAYCISFNENKAITGLGGGCIVTDDDAFARTCNLLKNHECAGGLNFKMPLPVAEMIYDQLQDFQAKRAHLVDISMAYDSALARVGLQSRPQGTPRWLTCTTLPSAAAVTRAIDALLEHGLIARRAWVPLCDGMPHADALAERGIVLPGGYAMKSSDVSLVAHVVADACLQEDA